MALGSSVEGDVKAGSVITESAYRKQSLYMSLGATLRAIVRKKL